MLRRLVGDDFQQLAQAAAEDHADSLQRGEVYTGRPVARQCGHRAAIDMRQLRQFGGFQLVALTDHGMSNYRGVLRRIGTISGLRLKAAPGTMTSDRLRDRRETVSQ